MKKKLSIGSWAYIFNQDKPTTDFHEILHKLEHLGYEGVELGSFGVHPTPVTHPTKSSRHSSWVRATAVPGGFSWWITNSIVTTFS